MGLLLLYSTCQRIIECFVLEGIFRGRLAQPLCSEQGHLWLDQVAHSPVSFELDAESVGGCMGMFFCTQQQYRYPLEKYLSLQPFAPEKDVWGTQHLIFGNGIYAAGGLLFSLKCGTILKGKEKRKATAVTNSGCKGWEMKTICFCWWCARGKSFSPEAFCEAWRWSKGDSLGRPAKFCSCSGLTLCNCTGWEPSG